MTKQKPDFANSANQIESWYDIREDWTLIESSLAKQYGIRIRQHTDMQWTEFCIFVSGLMPDTPLGQVVSIRAEQDMEIIRKYTPEQNRIYSDWQSRIARKKLENPEQLEKDMENLSKTLAAAFGKRR